jgi:hypothetical protein
MFKENKKFWLKNAGAVSMAFHNKLSKYAASITKTVVSFPSGVLMG